MLCHQCGSVLREGDRFCAACGAAAGDSGAPKDPLVGRTIGDAYVILDVVGVGGMGRVYRAEQRMLGRTVAIKVIHPHLLADEQSVARFYNEARAASRLNHPNSVSIIDFGRTDDGMLYLVMEFLQGRDLARIVRDDGLPPFDRVCDIVGAVLDALGEAHALGVVHRDLKPENVIIERMRTGKDLIKVVDFGLAKLLSGANAESSITSPGLVCGTPDYMSPEQGRGFPVDERGDIYSVGVLLYELLTGDLPFVADTPTNVVLRHIQDPVPDPRDEVPERNIPAPLAEVVLRALQKQPEQRYQTAQEMAEALRAVGRELGAGASEVACSACGELSLPTARFCAGCGAPLVAQAPSPSRSAPRMSMPPRMDLASGHHALLIARDDDLSRIEELREREGFVSVCVAGEPGIGKTRLLAELAERASAAGDLVVGAGPHDSGAAVPYHPVRTILLSLLGKDREALSELATSLEEDYPLVAAGMRELLSPAGLRGADGQSCAGAVAAALAFAISDAVRHVDAERVLLMFDDLQQCDGLSIMALGELPRHTGGLHLMLVTASSQGAHRALPQDTETLLLRALTQDEARALMGGVRPDVPPSTSDADRQFLPLYLTQLRAMGLAIDGVPHTLPQRLADAVTQRVQRLSLAARRVLQAASVLGSRCCRDELLAMVDDHDSAGLTVLKGVGLLVEQDDYIEVEHPFIRDLVEASIPAEARKALHARALSVVKAAPLEVRARHAYGAGEALSAIMLLERAGDLAFSRGDPATAVAYFRRGLELVRRELLETGDTSLEGAIAGFSRKLGNALAHKGDLTGADGVLREALEFCGPASSTRAAILLGLGDVSARRRSTRDAYRLMGEALETAIQADDELTQAAVQRAVGLLRRNEGNMEGAVAALRSAMALLAARGAPKLERAGVAVELGAILVHGDDGEAARQTLEQARALAAEAEAPHLQARIAEAEALLSEAGGQREEAAEHYRAAEHAAARAGDARASAFYDRAGEAERDRASARPA
ncbi:MAG: protein kinase [Myxococcales bacterium]|jgi:serine/threonine-protein kinase